MKEDTAAKDTEIISLKTQQKVLEQKNAYWEQAVNDIKQELSLERQKVLDLHHKLSTAEADLKNLNEKLQNQKDEISTLQTKFTLEFKNLANEIFEEKSKKFTDQNKLNITEVLNPLKERILEFEKKIDLSNKEAVSWNASLKEQISGLKLLNQQMSKEAENLTKALKGESKIQGNWGEFILESILERSGLEKGREYLVQESMKGDNGKRYQPDIIIKLPEDKHIIIDAKVSLTAYERYFNGEEDEQKVAALKQHLSSIKSHVKGLSQKNYQNLYQLKSLDFVLMFIPLEPAFSLAVQQDQHLFNDAFEKNIVLVSPSTLLATLRTIASIWRQENQNRNALEIARQGGDLYDKFVLFVQDLSELGNRLNTTRDTYDKVMNKLTEGRGNLVKRAENIKKLGASASKILPADLLEKAEEVDD
ncbi:MAG: DNA recombination protein RmuC [Candidatus Cyclobacteriaceae bacterium M3_2C_046]